MNEEMGGYGDSCVPCPDGIFEAKDGIGPCLPWSRNSFSRTGASECIPCPEGTVVMRDVSCGECTPGRFYDFSSFICLGCCPGSYTDSPNIQPKCYWCGENSFSEFASSQWVECHKGKGVIKSSGTCEICEPGQFYSYKDFSCIDCSHGYFSPYENQNFCYKGPM